MGASLTFYCIYIYTLPRPVFFPSFLIITATHCYGSISSGRRRASISSGAYFPLDIPLIIYLVYKPTIT
ncbi:hypothetical protein GGR52DRAFT_546358 [Hypoxylon sp. FL1284]|nr:hypothetical protein GGR52DRAFT_546358 [Hypoxylon sp. FL1284]